MANFLRREGLGIAWVISLLIAGILPFPLGGTLVTFFSILALRQIRRNSTAGAGRRWLIIAETALGGSWLLTLILTILR